MELIERALAGGAQNLSEHASKEVLAAYGIPVTRESVADSLETALEQAGAIGYPVALKASGEGVRHKTEADWLVLDIRDQNQLRDAYDSLMSHASAGFDGLLVQQMVKGKRELMAGLKQDPQFGPCVVFGLGGVLAEILDDISIRVAPLERFDAMDMMADIRARKILDAFRGSPPVDREALADILVTLGRIGLENPAIAEIDINPLKLIDGRPIAVDALILLRTDHE